MVRKWWFRPRLAGQIALLSAASFLIVWSGVSLGLGERRTEQPSPRAAARTAAPEPRAAVLEATVPGAVAGNEPQNAATAPHAPQAPAAVQAVHPVDAANAPVPVQVSKAADSRPRLALVSIDARGTPRDPIPGSQPTLGDWEPSPDPGPVTTQGTGPAPALALAKVEPGPPALPAPSAPAPQAVPAKRIEPRPAAPMAAPPPAFSPMLLGKWVPHKDACADPEGTEYLPLVISRSKATAGDGSCTFVSKKRVGKLWNVVAECSDGEATWRSNVTLAAGRDELTWSSERGAQSYVRCAPDTVVAKAPKKANVASAAPAKRARVAARKPAASVQVVRGAPAAGNPGWVMLKLP
jgi:hypothetical protein